MNILKDSTYTTYSKDVWAPDAIKTLNKRISWTQHASELPEIYRRSIEKGLALAYTQDCVRHAEIDIKRRHPIMFNFDTDGMILYVLGSPEIAKVSFKNADGSKLSYYPKDLQCGKFEYITKFVDEYDYYQKLFDNTPEADFAQLSPYALNNYSQGYLTHS